MRILYVGDTACLPDDLSDYIGDMGDEWTVETVADGKSAMFAAQERVGCGARFCQ